MKTSTVILTGLLFLSKTALAGAPECRGVLEASQSDKLGAAEISFASEIPAKTQQMIRDTLAETKKMYLGLQLPERIQVVINDNKEAGLADTNMLTNTILLAKPFFVLSEPLAKAAISHEYTHMVVVRGFKEPGKTAMLYDLLQAKGDSLDVASLLEAHTPYAELLCDLMPTLMTRDPKLFAKAILELKDIMAKDPNLAKYGEKLIVDQPVDLSLRDFSVSDKDPRWATYAPKDGHYNRFNQIRSYLWNRWVKDLPKGKEPEFFQATFNLLGQIYTGGELDAMLMSSDIAETNEQLIQFLDANLAKQFGPR